MGPACPRPQVLDDAAVAKHEKNVQPYRKHTPSCSTLVLLGVAAIYCKTVVKNGDWREGGASPTSTKAQTSASGGACLPQWLPLFLAFHSRHDGNPASPFDAPWSLLLGANADSKEQRRSLDASPEPSLDREVPSPPPPSPSPPPPSPSPPPPSPSPPAPSPPPPSAPPLRQSVDLGTAERFALLTETGITTTGVTSVTGLTLTLPLPLPYLYP